MLQAPFLPEIDVFGEGSNLSLREILCNVCAAVWPELAQQLGNITQLTSLPANDVTVLINMHLGEVDTERTDLHFAQVVSGHKKQKPQ